MNLRRKPLVIAVSLVLALPLSTLARVPSLQSRTAASPSVEEIAAATSQRLLVLQSGIFDPLTQALESRTLALPRISGSPYVVVQFDAGKRLNEKQLRALGATLLEYIPHNAYLVRLDDPADTRLSRHAGVRFVGSWQPTWKVAPDLQNLPTGLNTVIVDVFGFRGASQQDFAERVAQSVTHGEFAGGDRIGDLPHAWFRVANASLPDFLREAALINDVSWMERFQMPVLNNRDSVAAIQSNTASSAGGPTAAQASIWTKGLTGSNQIVAVSDSGLDRNQEFFIKLDKGAGAVTAVTNAQNTNPPTPGTLYPNNKVIGYFVMPGATPYDDNNQCTPQSSSTSFHGTHTSGSVAGDSGTTSTPTAGNWNTGDGMAPNAQLLFQDIGDDATGCLSGVGGIVMWQQAKAAGAYISSNSYGSPATPSYSASDYEVDQTTWENEDMLIAFSAGNNGPTGSSIGHPGHSKNALTVGALGHGNSTTVAGFSSRGPTSDGRRKPDIQAPGSGIVSAGGNDEDASPNGGTATQTLEGTSMSTPTTAGAAALMRQYFTDGYYPSGTKTASDARKPLGAELKAGLMNGTSFISGTPGNTAGWGRVWLDNNLYFTSETASRDLRMFAYANDSGIVNSETRSYEVQVGAGQEFRATLAWFDPPAALATGVSLVNNLDLEVQQGANLYRGNVFSAPGVGSISSAGGTADVLNNVEQVRFIAPVAGTYTVRVRGTNVPGNALRYSQQQGYALAVSTAQCATAVTAAPAAPVLTANSTAVDAVVGTVTGATSYQLYRSEGTCATAAASDFQLTTTSASNNLSDTHAQGGISYAYKLRGADACGEGPISACAEILSNATCTLLPEFDAQSVSISNAPGGGCGLDVNWSAATSACTLAPTMIYNIYRSTDPLFTPSAANRIAMGVVGTTFHDALVDSFATYYYAVRAEDTTTGNSGPNGGNETPENFLTKQTPTAATSSPGTFADGADAPSYLNLDSGWSVSNDRAATGTYSYRSARDGASTYTSDSCAAITTPVLPISATSLLTFKARYDVEADWDGVVMEISTDNGANWSNLTPDQGYPNDFSDTQGNGCGYPSSQGAFNGSSGGAFQTFTRTLASFAGQNAMIRWRFSSDGAAEEEGFYLDDVQISNSTTPDACLGINLFQNGFE